MTPSRIKIPLDGVERLRDVKSLLMAKTGIPVRQQIIYFRGRQLKSLRRPLFTYGVKDEATLYLVKKLVFCRCLACRNSRYIEREEVAEERERLQVIQPLLDDGASDLDDFLLPETVRYVGEELDNEVVPTQQPLADDGLEGEQDPGNLRIGPTIPSQQNEDNDGENDIDDDIEASEEADDVEFEVGEEDAAEASEAEEAEEEAEVDDASDAEDVNEEAEEEDNAGAEDMDVTISESEELLEAIKEDDQNENIEADDGVITESVAEDAAAEDITAEDADEEEEEEEEVEVEDTEEEEEEIELAEDLPQDAEDEDEENILYRLASDVDVEADATAPQAQAEERRSQNNGDDEDVSPSASAVHFPRQALFEEDGTNSVGEIPDVAELEDDEEGSAPVVAAGTAEDVSATELLLNMTRPSVLDDSEVDTEPGEDPAAGDVAREESLVELRPEDEDPGYMSGDELEEDL